MYQIKLRGRLLPNMVGSCIGIFKYGSFEMKTCFLGVLFEQVSYSKQDGRHGTELMFTLSRSDLSVSETPAAEHFHLTMPCII